MPKGVFRPTWQPPARRRTVLVAFASVAPEEPPEPTPSGARRAVLAVRVRVGL